MGIVGGGTVHSRQNNTSGTLGDWSVLDTVQAQNMVSETL